MLDQARYRTIPALVLEAAADRVRIWNPAYRTGLLVPTEVVELLRYFETPHSLSELSAEHDGIDRKVLDDLVKRFILLPAADHAVLLHGLTVPASAPLGQPTELLELALPAGRRGLCVLGAPCDVGTTGEAGARCGPALVRSHSPLRLPEAVPRFVSPSSPEAGAERPPVTPPTTRFLDLEFRRQVDVTGLAVMDAGDVPRVPGEGLAAYGARLHAAAERVVAAGFVPITLGGDHSITRFLLRPHVERQRAAGLGILHFDAHHDIYALPPGRLTHANPFEEALADPALRYLRQIGLRTIEPAGPHEVVADPRVTYVSAREVQRLTPEEIFADLPRGLPCYLTFDIDCMAPELCPETGTPRAGGLTYYQALELVDFASRSFPLVGADLVEVAAGPLAPNRAARIAASLLIRLILAQCPSEPLGPYQQRYPAQTLAIIPAAPAAPPST